MRSPAGNDAHATDSRFSSLTESAIARLWFRLLESRRRFQLSSGGVVEVVSGGRLTSSPGPDLSGVVIRHDGVKISGAGEIHRRPGQWYTHGHHENPAYNRVVLHLCLEPAEAPADVRREDGRPVPALSLSAYDFSSRGQTQAPGSTGCRICRATAANLRTTLARAGRAWLYHRAARFRRLSSGRRLFQPLVESLGYTYNHAAFRGLARRIDPSRFRRRCRRFGSVVPLEGWLLGRGGWFHGDFGSGLNRAVQRRRRCWRNDPDPPLVRTRAFWRRGKVRPQSYPCRRWVAFGHATARLGRDWRSWLLETAPDLLAPGEFRPRLQSRVLELFSLSAKSYWSHHYTFRDGRKESVPAPVGPGWFDQVAVNVFLPFLYSYYLYRGDSRLERVARILTRYPPVLSNRRTRKFFRTSGEEADEISVLHQQGAVFVHKQACRNCERPASDCPVAGA